MKRDLFFLLMAGFFISGCAKIAHMQELLTLKAYSDEGAAQERYIEKQDKKFEQLLVAVRENAIIPGIGKKSFFKKYGEPVYVREMVCDGASCDQWLYRYAVRPFDSDKVYVYFSKGGKLLSWQYVPREDKKEGEDDQCGQDKKKEDHC